MAPLLHHHYAWLKLGDILLPQNELYMLGGTLNACQRVWENMRRNGGRSGGRNFFSMYS